MSLGSEIDLQQLSQAIDARLAAGQPEAGAALARVVLMRLPRHLATYQRLLRACWQLKRTQEGEDWARRLLQADPANALAWRSLAYAVEQKEMRNAARSMWQRAFEADPYGPDIRAGLSRTSLDRSSILGLNTACLATLYLRGGRWPQAARTYWSLMQVEPRRIDFQLHGAVALWQQNAKQEAYRLARHLTQHHPHLLLAWVVRNALGDVDDRALARSPILSMDPDGEFTRQWLGIPFGGARMELTLTPREADLLAA
jgi:tetratricopeptide (TPR) repeat protein